MNATEEAEHRVAVAVAAVESAARATEAARAMLVEGKIGAVTKSDASPVTVADFASQAIVVRHLLREFGDAPVFGEESDAILREDAALLANVVLAARHADPNITADDVVAALSRPHADPRAGPCWTLDPVDGTKGFLRGGQYAIALAWLEAGAPTAAAMACPRLDPSANDPAPPASTGVVFAARRGDGSRVKQLGSGTFAPVHRRDWRAGDRIRLALSVESAHGDSDAAVVLAQRASSNVSALRLDSCSKYGLVAAGAADCYIRLPRGAGGTERVWDHAAGTLVALEAGCVVCDASGAALNFGCGPTLSANAGIVVAPPTLAALLVSPLLVNPLPLNR